MKKAFILFITFGIGLQLQAQWLNPVHLDDLNNDACKVMKAGGIGYY